MEPVLLFKEDQKIENELDTLNNFIPVFQGIYDAIVSLGITPTIPEIDALIAGVKSPQPFVNSGTVPAGPPAAEAIKSYVLDKLTRAAMPYVVNNITYPYSEVRKLITLPDISPIVKAFTPVAGVAYKNNFEGHVRDLRSKLLTLKDGVISAAPTATATITAMYSYYTKTDASAKLANEIQTVCDSLNVFNKANGNICERRIPKNGSDRFNNYHTEVPGVAITHDGNYIVSPWFIEKFESHGTLHFA